MVFTDVDMQHLRRCVELARTAPEAGHGPFGAVLVAAGGRDPACSDESGSGATHSDHHVYVVRALPDMGTVAPGSVVDGPAAEALYEARYRR